MTSDTDRLHAADYRAAHTAMEIAGHSTIEMTMKVYGHVSLDEKRVALDKLGTIFEEEDR